MDVASYSRLLAYCADCILLCIFLNCQRLLPQSYARGIYLTAACTAQAMPRMGAAAAGVAAMSQGIKDHLKARGENIAAERITRSEEAQCRQCADASPEGVVELKLCTCAAELSDRFGLEAITDATGLLLPPPICATDVASFATPCQQRVSSLVSVCVRAANSHVCTANVAQK